MLMYETGAGLCYESQCSSTPYSVCYCTTMQAATGTLQASRYDHKDIQELAHLKTSRRALQ